MRNPLSTNHGRISWILAIILMAVVWQPLTAAGAADEEGIQITVERFVIDGESPISQGGVDQALKPYTGRPLAFADLEDAASALQSAFLDAGFPFYRVVLPPQRIAGGQVRLKVVAFTLKNIQVEENQHFDEANILRSLPPLQIGASPNTLEVARALQFANEHPAKRVATFVKQTPGSEGIDARIVARDTRPYTIFGSINNTGTKDPGRTRTAVGLQHSNLFNRDHILTATYTTSPDDVDDVSQYGVNYRLPFYKLATELEAFYSYSEVDQGAIGDFFDVSGRGQFYGFNLNHTLIPVGAYNHKVSLRYQDRFFDNETRFLGTLLLPDVRTTPLGIRYSASYEPKNFTLGAFAGWEINTGLGSDNDPENYLANREGGDRQWNKFTGGGHLQWVLPGDFQLRGRFNGQYSDRRLIPGEQFGIGGCGSVRGYEGREVTGDYGVQGSLEAWSPPLPFDTRMVLFGDAGFVRRHAPHPGVDDRDGISSVGIGLHWNWKGYIDVSCEVAQALENAVTTEAGDTRFLYQVFLRY